MPNSWSIRARRFVSRGGIKLDNALSALGIDVAGRDCLDVGASTGGFTDCLLQRGAARVIALDVAYGQIDLRLREDPRVTVIERLNARSLEPADLPFAPDLATVDVSFISLTKILPAVAALHRDRRRDPGDGQAAVRARPRARRPGRRPRPRRPARGDPHGRRRGARTSACRFAGFASSGLAGPKGNLETFVWCGGVGEEVADLEAASRGGRTMSRAAVAALITHSHPPATTDAVEIAIAAALAGSCRLVATPDEIAKHGAAAEEIETVEELPSDVDLCLVLGGDGSILHALRHFARTGVPVFGVNFGTVGFLAAVERDEVAVGNRTRASPASSRWSTCPGSRSRSTARRRSPSTTSASSAARTTVSPS